MRHVGHRKTAEKVGRGDSLTLASGAAGDENSYRSNLSRALLLVHSLTQALVRKGLVTREEIAAVAAQLDMLDGQADGKLAPGNVAGTVKAPERPLTPSEFLGKLEKS